MSSRNSTPSRRNSDLRRLNSEDVVDLLRRHGRLSRAKLAAHTTLTNQALAGILNELVETGHVLEVEWRGGQRGRGRPALLYEYNSERLAVASLYIGLRYAEVSLCDGVGRELANTAEFAPGWDVGRVVEESATHVAELLERCNVDRRRCHVAAVVHGDVDTRARVVSIAGMGWSDVPLAELLAERTGTDVSVHDVARAAAVAEYREGVATGASRVVVFNLGPEFAATQIIDGVLDTGSSGRAGIIGRCRIPAPTGVTTIDDSIGSVVAKRRYTELSGVDVEWMTDVHALARAGDAHAQEVMRTQTDGVAFASGWLINVLDPDRFVLTGSIGEYGEAEKARLHAAIVEQADPRALQHCSIRFSTMGRQAWIRGGVHSALERQQALERNEWPPADAR